VFLKIFLEKYTMYLVCPHVLVKKYLKRISILFHVFELIVWKDEDNYVFLMKKIILVLTWLVILVKKTIYLFIETNWFEWDKLIWVSYWTHNSLCVECSFWSLSLKSLLPYSSCFPSKLCVVWTSCVEQWLLKFLPTLLFVHFSILSLFEIANKIDHSESDHLRVGSSFSIGLHE